MLSFNIQVENIILIEQLGWKMEWWSSVKCAALCKQLVRGGALNAIMYGNK